MPNESLEQKVAEMGKIIDSLVKDNNQIKHEIERLHAVNEINNLMSKYEYLHVNEKHDEVIQLYAKKAPDVRVYFGQLGYWEGHDAPDRAWSLLKRRPMEERIGQIHFHPTCNPYVIVSGDGKTAKGVWVTDGIECPKIGDQLIPLWSWATYGVDFIKEDGEWKFWHFHIYRLFMSEYNHPWTTVEGWNPDRVSDHVPDDIKMDGPGIDDYPYRVDSLTVVKPDLPEPYEKWEDTTMF